MENHIFEVGLPIAIETYFKSYLTTHLIGWEPDVCLITGVVPPAGQTARLKVNDHCKMRFLKDGIAYGFETKILAISYNPMPLMFCKYPKVIEQFSIRKHNRIKVNLPARLYVMGDEQALEATITDISAGGCGLSIPLREGKEPLLAEKVCTVTFSAIEGVMNLYVVIRKIKALKDRQEVGAEFMKVSAEDHEKIKSFLDHCNKILTSRTDSILGKMKQTDKLFGGSLSEVSLIDIMQIYDQLRKDGVIRVEAQGQTGQIAIRDGLVLDATLGALKGEDALVELLSLSDGRFHISAKDTPAGYMNSPINFVLIEISRLIDERSSLQAFLPDRSDRLTLLKIPDSGDAEVQTVLTALQSGAGSAGEVYDATGLSLVRIRLVAARLLKDGALKINV